MKGLETNGAQHWGGKLDKLKALTRYEGFGNAGGGFTSASGVAKLKALTRYEGFGNAIIRLKCAAYRMVEGTDPL